VGKRFGEREYKLVGDNEREAVGTKVVDSVVDTEGKRLKLVVGYVGVLERKVGEEDGKGVDLQDGV